jgi:hypothetical protein
VPNLEENPAISRRLGELEGRGGWTERASATQKRRHDDDDGWQTMIGWWVEMVTCDTRCPVGTWRGVLYHTRSELSGCNPSVNSWRPIVGRCICKRTIKSEKRSVRVPFALLATGPARQKRRRLAATHIHMHREMSPNVGATSQTVKHAAYIVTRVAGTARACALQGVFLTLCPI